MNNKLSSIFVFAIGAAIGSVVTWKLVKTKYEQIAQEEIDSVKEVFSRRKREEESMDETETPRRPHVEEKPDLAEYVAMLKQAKYLADNPDANTEEKEVSAVEPYVITPEEFGEADGYDAKCLNYYADEILADDWGEIIKNADEVVGWDWLMHFGDYVEDVVHVRNDRLKMDYEITQDPRKYVDVHHDSRPAAEDEYAE